MVRLGRIVDDAVTLVGIAFLLLLGGCGLVLILVAHVLCVMLRNWWTVFLLVVAMVALFGCTTQPNQAPTDPRDPMIWRPTAPANHPLPR